MKTRMGKIYRRRNERRKLVNGGEKDFGRRRERRMNKEAEGNERRQKEKKR